MTISRIRLLPEQLVNRIAAGEVVERPAAALKELVENALDAGATRICAALDAGGVDRIEVVDDGVGMDEADLILAVQRHATSKLQDDALVQIATLGFRGEALPAIGAAARLTLISRKATAEHGWRIQVEGGVVSPPEPSAGPPGTRAVVRDLFFATPARRKFLKAARTEADHAEAALRRLAMAAPQVAFRLEIDGRTVLDLPQQSPRARVEALLGADAAAALLPVDCEQGMLGLLGFIAAPTVHRATGGGQHFVVNNRPVMDPVLKTAIRIAVRDVIVSGRHPVAALFLTVPPDELDVNVHPAKTELRFRDAAAVRGFVIHALHRALATPLGAVGGLAAGGPVPDVRSQSLGQPLPRSLPWSRPSGLGRSLPTAGGRGFAESQLPFRMEPAARTFVAPEDLPSPEHPLGAPVAQVLDTYIIAIAPDGGLILVDQHAAHERLTQEALQAGFAAGAVRAQPLLLPAVLDLPQADVNRLVQHAAALSQLGLELEAFGPGAVLVRALPAPLGAPDPAGLVRDIADELAEAGESTALRARLDQVMARMACHGSIRAGRTLQRQEMSALLRQMEATPRAATCSHGRPTFLKLSRLEIERLFGRT